MARSAIPVTALLVPVLATFAARAGARMPPADLDAEPAGRVLVRGQGTSVITLVNLDEAKAASALVEFRRQPLGELTTFAPPGAIAPSDSIDVALADLGTLTDGTYASVVRSDRRSAAQAVALWPATGGAAAYEQ